MTVVMQPVYVMADAATPPKKLHRPDCSHFTEGTLFRPAVPLELAKLPKCGGCLTETRRGQ